MATVKSSTILKIQKEFIFGYKMVLLFRWVTSKYDWWYCHLDFELLLNLFIGTTGLSTLSGCPISCLTSAMIFVSGATSGVVGTPGLLTTAFVSVRRLRGLTGSSSAVCTSTVSLISCKSSFWSLGSTTGLTWLTISLTRFTGWSSRSSLTSSWLLTRSEEECKTFYNK